MNASRTRHSNLVWGFIFLAMAVVAVTMLATLYWVWSTPIPSWPWPVI